jgi:hypothetical protein
MNRKRKKMAGNDQQDWSMNLDVVHPNAAGIASSGKRASLRGVFTDEIAVESRSPGKAQPPGQRDGHQKGERMRTVG